MKPRIVKAWGLWFCGVPGGRCGIGYDPLHAYAEWEALCKQ